MAVNVQDIYGTGTPGANIIQETTLRHPDYDRWHKKWRRIRDCIDGSDAVKEKRTEYLPRLTGQSNDEYNAYLKRALFFSVADRTLKAIVGLMTAREPTIEAPDEMRPYFEDIDNQGTSFFELSRWVIEEIVSNGRTGLLIDYPQAGGRAYTVPYIAENILNWNTNPAMRNLEMLVLAEEKFWPQPNTIHFISRYIEYRLLRIDQDGYYAGEVWRRSTADASLGSLNRRAVIEPTVRGERIDIIPFTFFTSEGINTELVKPPMLDIVDVNLSHYRSSADLEHGRHFTALPVPVVTGVESDDPLRVGSEQAWVLPPHQAKAYYLEFTGQGLQSLEKALKEKSDQMAIFSTRLMDTSSRGSESPDNVRIRHSSDAANMTRIAEVVENGFNRHYNMIKEMEGIGGPPVKITFNKHFLDPRLPAAELKELVKAFSEGAINEETLIFNLQRGDMMQTDTMDRTVDKSVPGPRKDGEFESGAGNEQGNDNNGDNENEDEET
ncbi:MAG: DUF4055 domain-containing protein [Acidimicrobiia bacterium]|nr:DUF4055 domain-containing protein [Acidimicrobiia bacterium]